MVGRVIVAHDTGVQFSVVPPISFGAVAQMGERAHRKREAESSILSCSTKFPVVLLWQDAVLFAKDGD